MTKLNLLLTEFFEQHRLGELGADEKGIYRIIIDGMEVRCFEKLGKGYFCSKLTALPKHANTLPIVLQDLMNHSLVRVKSQNCSLGLDENDDLLLFEGFDIESTNLRDFTETLENFTNALEEYRHFISSERTTQHATAEMVITP